jgi:hypothetical protein
VATTASEPHTIVQSWVSASVAQQLKAHARATGCSLSSLVRDAIEDQLRTSPPGEGPHPAGSSVSPPGRRPEEG